jgi:hypothetical protein
MSRRPYRFTEAEVTRATKAVVKAGVPVARVEVSPDGRIIVITGKPEQEHDPATEINEWDAVT